MSSNKKIIVLMLFVLSIFALSAQSVKFSISPGELSPGESGKISATLQIPEDQKQSIDPNDNIYFYIEASHPDLKFGSFKLPKPDKVVGDDEWQYFPSVTLSLPFTVRENAKLGERKITVELGYNLCYDDGMCNPPEEEESVVSLKVVKKALESSAAIVEDSPSEGLIEEEVLETEETLEADEPLAREVDEVDESEESPVKKGIVKFLIFAFLGGLILNITPCVLPILPIRIMAIINQAQEDRSKVLRHVLIYSLGVLISFAILAGILIGIQMAGQSAGWGIQNQNPYFQVSLLSIVFVFALSLLGVFEITAPGMDAANKATGKGGYGGSFFGGIFAFLMAISCTGPFLGAALPFAMAMPPLGTMVFFLMIGLGFAFPFILIGIFPAALKIIPKPGDWMVLFKELMGFVLLYLVYTMLKTTLMLTAGAYLINVIFFLLILGLAVWLYGRFVRFEYSKITQWIFIIIPVLMIVLGAWQFLPVKPEYLEAATAIVLEGDEMVADPDAPEGWYLFSPQLHARLMDEGKTVFMDIGAEWCKNCKTNERTVLFTDDMMEFFAENEVVLLRGDFTKSDPVLLDWIKSHERMGVPFNALYVPGEKPVIFPELLSKKMLRDAITKDN